MKEKILSEEGHRQQMKLKELQAVAERLGCTLPQLAIGESCPCFFPPQIPLYISFMLLFKNDVLCGQSLTGASSALAS